MMDKVSTAATAALMVAVVGSCEAFVAPGSGAAVSLTRLTNSVLAAQRTTTFSSCLVDRTAGVDFRLNMMSGAEGQVTDPNVLLAQMAGCTSLIGAGYKITWDKGAEEEGEKGGEGSEEVDIFRDTALRYLGYANEVGEAFRPLIPGYGVILSYAVAISYVTADAVSKGYSCAKESDSNLCAVPAAFDVLTFQMLASVILPGFTINRWVAFVTFLLSMFDVEAQFPGVTGWLPTAAGLALIPFIVAPLDNLVETVLDRTTRPILTDKFPSCELGPVFGSEE